MQQEKASLRSRILDGIIALIAISGLFWLLFTYSIPKQLQFNEEMAHRSNLASVEDANE